MGRIVSAIIVIIATTSLFAGGISAAEVSIRIDVDASSVRVISDDKGGSVVSADGMNSTNYFEFPSLPYRSLGVLIPQGEDIVSFRLEGGSMVELYGSVGSTHCEGLCYLGFASEVELVVSEGRDVVAVPDLEGRHLDDVEVLLARLRLLIGTVTFEPAALGAPGRVIGQSPPPGFGLREGGEVSVRVAGSPSEVIEMIQSGRDN